MKWKGVIALALVFVVNVSVAPPPSVGSHTSVWCLPAAGGWLVVRCQDWPVDHACRLARGRVGRRGQSQGATYTGGFQDFIVTALTPRPKLKSRGATYKGSATYAGGFTVVQNHSFPCFVFMMYCLTQCPLGNFSFVSIKINVWNKLFWNYFFFFAKQPFWLSDAK